MDASRQVRESAHIIEDGASRLGVGIGGEVVGDRRAVNGYPSFRVLGTLPPLYPEWLGDRAFLRTHGVRFPYIAGAMANGIATPRFVIAAAHAQMMADFGAGGLDPGQVEAGVAEIQLALGPAARNWCANLIHSPEEPELEEAITRLYLARDVRRATASAFMRLTPNIVHYACHGLRADADGRIARKNYLFAKVSRPEVAKLFLSPAPQPILDHLLGAGKLTRDEIALARHVPLAEDITAEADSGGHTDNRPLGALLPVILAARDQAAAQFGYATRVRIGAAGGLGTPHAVASAFALGAAYVLTGSINQCTVEAGVSHAAKQMLADAELADTVMAPSPDMFELGVKVQVLKRGTLFAARSSRLYELYRTHGSLEELSPQTRQQLEAEIFQAPLSQVWDETRRFFERRNVRQLERTASDPKHRMALVFRWYVGQSSRWAIAGDPKRRLDYQIWCGPAMGAFNAWVKGTFLEDPANRTVVGVARNLLEGAAVITRAQQFRSHGLPVPDSAFDVRPRRLK